jgi:hypothetical protein
VSDGNSSFGTTENKIKDIMRCLGFKKNLQNLKMTLLVLVFVPIFFIILKGKLPYIFEITERQVYRFTATDVMSATDGRIAITDHLADKVNSLLEMKLKNITEVSSQIIKHYEDHKATKEARLREMMWRFNFARNKTFVSYSPLYKMITGNMTGKNAPLNEEINSRPDVLLRSRNVHGINCQLMFGGDKREILKAETLYRPRDQDRFSFPETANCKRFIENRGYITDPLTEEEENFPIAYSIIVYKSPEQFEMLLRSIYRPQNFYCVHVDKKTKDNVFQDIMSILECFPNVFLASKRYAVVWGGLSVLLPEIVCMADLLARSRRWKYFINLTGQEFPLRTNYELVKILTILNGTNIVDSTVKE